MAKKDLITMRRVRSKQIRIREALKVHEAHARALRDRITANWEDKASDNVVATCGQMLTSTREGIRVCQQSLRQLKRELKGANRMYDLRHNR